MLGGYQLWNIPGGTGIESLQKKFMAAWMVLLVLDFFKKKLHTRLVLGIRAQLWTLVLGFKANVGLAFGRYRVHISGIETT